MFMVLKEIKELIITTKRMKNHVAKNSQKLNQNRWIRKRTIRNK